MCTPFFTGGINPRYPEGDWARTILKHDGITSVWSILGTTASFFTLHLEDGCLSSINHLHAGAAKVIPSQKGSLF